MASARKGEEGVDISKAPNFLDYLVRSLKVSRSYHDLASLELLQLVRCAYFEKHSQYEKHRQAACLLSSASFFVLPPLIFPVTASQWNPTLKKEAR